jgi:hypothetical protein
MIFLMAVLTLKVAVLVNTSFANRKWLEMAIEAKVDHQQQRKLGYCKRATYSSRASIECLNLEECSTKIVAIR